MPQLGGGSRYLYLSFCRFSYTFVWKVRYIVPYYAWSLNRVLFDLDFFAMPYFRSNPDNPHGLVEAWQWKARIGCKFTRIKWKLSGLSKALVSVCVFPLFFVAVSYSLISPPPVWGGVEGCCLCTDIKFDCHHSGCRNLITIFFLIILRGTFNINALESEVGIVVSQIYLDSSMGFE